MSGRLGFRGSISRSEPQTYAWKGGSIAVAIADVAEVSERNTELPLERLKP